MQFSFVIFVIGSCCFIVKGYTTPPNQLPRPQADAIQTTTPEPDNGLNFVGTVNPITTRPSSNTMTPPPHQTTTQSHIEHSDSSGTKTSTDDTTDTKIVIGIAIGILVLVAIAMCVIFYIPVYNVVLSECQRLSSWA